MKFSIKFGSVTVKSQSKINPVDVQINDVEVGVDDISLLEIPEIINSVKSAIKDIEKSAHDNRMQVKQMQHDREDIVYERSIQERKERNHRFQQVANDFNNASSPSADETEEKTF